MELTDTQTVIALIIALGLFIVWIVTKSLVITRRLFIQAYLAKEIGYQVYLNLEYAKQDLEEYPTIDILVNDLWIEVHHKDEYVEHEEALKIEIK